VSKIGEHDTVLLLAKILTRKLDHFWGSPHENGLLCKFWRRFWGLVIDVLICIPFALIIIRSGISNYFIWPAIPHIIFEATYYISFWLIKSATPGMMLMKIKIVTDKGPLTFWRVIIRCVGLFITSFLWGLGGLWMIWDKKRQTWQDKMAGTFVVRAD